MMSSIRIAGFYGRAAFLQGIRIESLPLRVVIEDDLRTRLRLSDEDMRLVDHLAALAPTGRAAQPARGDAPALLERLGVQPDDASEILDHWPDETWPEE